MKVHKIYRMGLNKIINYQFTIYKSKQLLLKDARIQHLTISNKIKINNHS